jgi:hypothetical protein
MSDVTTENAAFTQVVDTIYDSKVLAGLVSSGVLPSTFRVIKGTITFDASATAVGYPIIDSYTGEQVLLNSTQAILYAAAYAHAAAPIVGVSAPTFSIGLGTTASSGATGQLLFVAAKSVANVNAGFSSMTVATSTSGTNEPVIRSFQTVSTFNFLQVDVGVGSVTSGTLNVILIVV